MKLLLDQGCTVLPRRARTPSALHWACEGGSVECARLLLDNGLDPNMATKFVYYAGRFIINTQVRPIMLAARSGNHIVVRLLVERGAEVDVVDREGLTALLYAVKMDYDIVVETLLALGANPDGIEAPFVPLEDEVEEMGGEEYICGEWEKATGFLSPLFMAVKYDCLNALKVLLRANCKLYIYGYYDNTELVTPFELALYKGNVTAAKMLVIAGFSFEVTNPDSFGELYLKLFGEGEDLPYLLMCSSNVPRPLLYLARGCIRQCLGQQAHAGIPTLPLPPTLQRFLDLEELDRVTSARRADMFD